MSELAAPEGVIAGGWSFVIAGYVVTAVVLAAYTVSLWIRGKSEGEES